MRMYRYAYHIVDMLFSLAATVALFALGVLHALASPRRGISCDAQGRGVYHCG
jgi:hypothetical protein